MMLKITVLVDNRVSRRGLSAEHGLSLWLDCDDCRMLFDAGQSELYLRNAAVLGIDLQSADRLVLSHGHYDHGGGFAFFPVDGTGALPRFVMHPQALRPRYARSAAGTDRPVGLPWSLGQLPGLARHIIYNQATLQIAPHAWLLSQIPDLGGYASISSGFFADDEQGKRTADLFYDEQIMISRQSGGLVVITGCCHCGLPGTIRAVQQLFPNDQIQAIIGGFHLNHTGQQDLERLMADLVTVPFRYLVPLHCTGLDAACLLRQIFPDRCVCLETGDSLMIDTDLEVLHQPD